MNILKYNNHMKIIILGGLLLVVGVTFFIKTTYELIKGEGGIYGNEIKGYVGAFIFILLGLVLIMNNL